MFLLRKHHRKLLQHAQPLLVKGRSCRFIVRRKGLPVDAAPVDQAAVALAFLPGVLRTDAVKRKSRPGRLPGLPRYN